MHIITPFSQQNFLDADVAQWREVISNKDPTMISHVNMLVMELKAADVWPLIRHLIVVAKTEDDSLIDIVTRDIVATTGVPWSATTGWNFPADPNGVRLEGGDGNSYETMFMLYGEDRNYNSSPNPMMRTGDNSASENSPFVYRLTRDDISVNHFQYDIAYGIVEYFVGPILNITSNAILFTGFRTRFNATSDHTLYINENEYTQSANFSPTYTPAVSVFTGAGRGYAFGNMIAGAAPSSAQMIALEQALEKFGTSMGYSVP